MEEELDTTVKNLCDDKKFVKVFNEQEYVAVCQDPGVFVRSMLAALLENKREETQKRLDEIASACSFTFKFVIVW